MATVTVYSRAAGQVAALNPANGSQVRQQTGTGAPQWVGLSSATFSQCVVAFTQIGTTGFYSAAIDVADATLTHQLVHWPATAIAFSDIEYSRPLYTPTDPRANITQVNADTTAPANMAAMYNGTGYAGGTIPLNANVSKIAGQTANASGAVTFPGTISSYAGADTAGTATLLTRIPQTITMAQIGGTGSYYVKAISSAGSVIPAAIDIVSNGAITTESGKVSNVGTVDTVTTLTTLPAAPDSWLTAAAIAANAFDGKGDWLLASEYTAPDNEEIAALVSVAPDNKPTVAADGTTAIDPQAIANAVNNLAPEGEQGDGSLGARVDGIAAAEGGNGTGDVLVDHNYGGTDALRVLDSDGVPADNVRIRAYVTADLTAGTVDPIPPETSTGSDGRWVDPLMLDSGTYTLNFYNPATKRTTTASLAVS